MSEERLSEAMVAVVNYALARGVENMAALKGCWEERIDEDWWIALNGHREPVRCSRGAEVWPFTCYVEFRGTVAGVVHPFGGEFLAAVPTSNHASTEDAFIDAIRARTPEEGS